MNRVLTIFRKDARHLWMQVLLFFATGALAVVTDPALGVHRFEYLAPILEPVACWVLIVAVIHEERLIGHEQYWLTRPYTWKNLVAAKALFLVTFVSLPLFVCQYIILAAVNGSVPAGWLGALLWRQVFFAIFVILPAVAFAVVTANLAQVLLCVVVSFPFFVVTSSLFHASDWGGFAWIRTCAAALVILLGVAVVVTLQYTRRRTGIARVAVAATLALTTAVAGAPRWGPAFAVQRLFSRQAVGDAAVSLSVDASAIGTHPAERQASMPAPNPGMLEIPLRVRDLPPGLWLGGEWVSVTLEAPGERWSSKWLPAQFLRGLRDQVGWILVYPDPDFYDRWKNTPVKLSATADLILYQHIRDEEVSPGTWIADPETGLRGWFNLGGQLACTSPFLQTAITLELGPSQSRQEISSQRSFAPFPTAVSFRPFDEPLRWRYIDPLPKARLSLDRPVAYIQRHFEAREIRMKDLVIP
jgi:hypothetical protein